jgi:hypothetical protein
MRIIIYQPGNGQHGKWPVLIMLLLLPLLQAAAQCPQFPADCPSDIQLPDSAARLLNPVLPQEVSMELRLHGFLSGLIQQVADRQHWDLYEYEESAATGFLNAERTGPLAYRFRPPHEYAIGFVIIISRDSLDAWKHWWNNDYMTLFVPENAARIESIQAMGKKRTGLFRNASMLRVKIGVNENQSPPSSNMDGIRQTGKLQVAGASLALMMHNDKPDEQAMFDVDQFNRCSDFAFLLFGKWNLRPDAGGMYRPAYCSDPKNTDKTSIKAVPCDQVQNMVMHVEGSPSSVRLFLSLFDSQKLANQIK